jgi:hypothetical protein
MKVYVVGFAMAYEPWDIIKIFYTKDAAYEYINRVNHNETRIREYLESDPLGGYCYDHYLIVERTIE